MIDRTDRGTIEKRGFFGNNDLSHRVRAISREISTRAASASGSPGLCRALVHKRPSSTCNVSSAAGEKALRREHSHQKATQIAAFDRRIARKLPRIICYPQTCSRSVFDQ